eukprot:scaffold11529_cov135-Isochrysis_galbana.AAC.1
MVQGTVGAGFDADQSLVGAPPASQPSNVAAVLRACPSAPPAQHVPSVPHQPAPAPPALRQQCSMPRLPRFALARWH